MMTSDSDESDYEDARQHHDNEVDGIATPAYSNTIISVSHDPPNQGPSSSQTNTSESRELQDSRFHTPSSSNVQPRDEIRQISVENASVDEVVNHGELESDVQNEPVAVENVEVVNEIAQPDIEGVEARDELENAIENVEVILNRYEEYFLNERNRRAVVDSDDDDVETLSSYGEIVIGDRASSDDESHNGEHDPNLQHFDQQLPIRHTYLGEDMEALQGRVVLDENSTPEIPLIAMGIHLIPGQTLPLTIFHAVFQNAIRRCVMSDRLFGIVHNDTDIPSGNVVYKGALGTLAEIYEYQEEADGEGPTPMSSSFALKAKGRQRFNVIDVRRQADGNLMGRVQIRPEIRLEPFVLSILLPASSRCLLPKTVTEESDTATAKTTTKSNDNTTRESVSKQNSTMSTASTCEPDKELTALKSKILVQRKRLKYYSVQTPHPYFVYEQYDETVLVEKVHRILKTELKGLTESGGKIPVDATDLSFWLAQNLTMDDSHRTKILKMDNPVQRLRYELELLAQTTKVISCRNCQTNVADYSQIFSMSVEGPQGTYVNPHGFVHEALTVLAIKNLTTRGQSSTEASWFPGYSWTIVECKRCGSHVGWKFLALNRLKPSRFWGLARRSVIFKYDCGSHSDLQEYVSNPRTSLNSTNSEGFASVALN